MSLCYNLHVLVRNERGKKPDQLPQLNQQCCTSKTLFLGFSPVKGRKVNKQILTRLFTCSDSFETAKMQYSSFLFIKPVNGKRSNCKNTFWKKIPPGFNQKIRYFSNYHTTCTVFKNGGGLGPWIKLIWS